MALVRQDVQHHARAQRVHFHVPRHVVHRLAHPDFGGQVVDHFRLALAQDRHQVGADDVILDELEPVVAAGVIEVGGPAGTEVVDADHRVPVGQQTIDQG